MKRCPKCRTQVPEEARVCPACPWIFPQDEPAPDGSEGVAVQGSILPLVALVLGAAVLFAGWAIVMNTSDKKGASSIFGATGTFKSAEAAPIVASSVIVLYGPEEGRDTYRMLEALKLRGLSGSVVSVGNLDDIKALDLLEKAQAAGVESGGSFSLPFASVDGQLYSRQAMDEALAALPISHPRLQEGPYIIVYGAGNCSIEAGLIRQLDDNGFPYEFHNVNEPRYVARLDAFRDVLGDRVAQLPVYEINGQMFSQPSIEVVRENYR